MVIEGPVASGKTELLQSAAELAVKSSFTFLGATASHAEQVLPVGVIGQLFHAAPLSDDDRRHVEALLADVALAWSLHGTDSEATRQATAPLLRSLSLALLRLAEESPLLIGVDDVHLVDEASWQCLSYVVRRMSSARILLVLTGDNSIERASPLLSRELLCQPRCRRLHVGPLSQAGVTELLTQQFARSAAEALAADMFRVSGGSPVLVQALIQDTGRASRTGPLRLVVGNAFSHAVMGILFRLESTVRAVARALAVVQEPVPSELLAQLLGLEVRSVEAAVEALERSGFLVDGWYRHQRSVAAVLSSMAADERTALHRVAAALLHRVGAAATRVAQHILATGSTPPAWALSVLRQAAEQSVQEGEVEFALSCLRLAEQECADPVDLAAIRPLLARLEWRSKPATVVRHLAPMVTDVREGRLTGSAALAPLGYLQWHGHIDEAVEVFAAAQATEDPDAKTLRALESARLWFSFWYPTYAARLPARPEAPTDPAPLFTPQEQARAILWTALSKGANDEAVRAAEQLLQQTRLDDDTVAAMAVAVTSLLYADRLDAAWTWCEPMVHEAKKLHAPTWLALFMAIRAEIAVRQGDLLKAEEYAREALGAFEPQSWGIMIGLPLGTLLRATTAAGKTDAAVSCLRVPVPSVIFETPLGLHYLQARGQFHLATGSARLALQDFRTCGELMSKWGIDLPGLVPWRAEAAHAWLQLGEARQAGHLVQEQLARLGPNSTRTRGISLRLLAATSDAHKRPALLNEAVRVLKKSGDRLELAHAFADLSRALNAVGEANRARMMLRTADLLAKQCHARDLAGGPASPDRAPAPERKDEWLENTATLVGLSSAERRVVVLAATGNTNREIARKLFVTVSTVEQHLTRAYRKLEVTRRSDLPTVL